MEVFYSLGGRAWLVNGSYTWGAGIYGYYFKCGDTISTSPVLNIQIGAEAGIDPGSVLLFVGTAIITHLKEKCCD